MKAVKIRQAKDLLASTLALSCLLTITYPGIAYGAAHQILPTDAQLSSWGLNRQAYQQLNEPDRSKLIDLLLSRNDFDAALDVANEAIKKEPKDADNYFRVAQIYIQQWRLREALPLIDKAITLNADNAKYHRSKASILRWQKDFAAAIVEQTKAVELSKDKSFELIELAGINYLAGNINKACDNLQEALKAEPNNQAAHQRLVELLTREKRYDDLIAEYKRVCALNDKDESYHLGLANAYKLAGKLDEAIAEYKLAANLNGKDPMPHQALGAIYAGNKDYDKAAKEYTFALNINPGSGDDLVALGFCYAQNADYLQAETAFVTALALKQLTQNANPAMAQGRLDLLRSLAMLFFTEGRYTEAVQQLQTIRTQAQADKLATGDDQFMLLEAQALRDRSAEATQDLMNAYQGLSKADQDKQALGVVDVLLTLNDADKAKPIIEAYATTNSGIAWQIAKAKSARLSGDLTNAKQAIEAALTMPATDDKDKVSEAEIELGYILLASGDTTGATKAFSDACKDNAKSFAAYQGLGEVALKTKQPQVARDAASHALEINPYSAKSYILLGDSYLAANKMQAGVESYKKAIDIYPTNIEAHKRLLAAYEKLALPQEAKQEQLTINRLELQAASVGDKQPYGK